MMFLNLQFASNFRTRTDQFKYILYIQLSVMLVPQLLVRLTRILITFATPQVPIITEPYLANGCSKNVQEPYNQQPFNINRVNKSRSSEKKKFSLTSFKERYSYHLKTLGTVQHYSSSYAIYQTYLRMAQSTYEVRITINLHNSF